MAKQCIFGKVKPNFRHVLLQKFDFFHLSLFRSKIQGLGLYAARDLEKHTMVIEYIGEVIRSELSELREKQYEAKVSLEEIFVVKLKLGLQIQLRNLF